MGSQEGRVGCHRQQKALRADVCRLMNLIRGRFPSLACVIKQSGFSRLLDVFNQLVFNIFKNF